MIPSEADSARLRSLAALPCGLANVETCYSRRESQSAHKAECEAGDDRTEGAEIEFTSQGQWRSPEKRPHVCQSHKDVRNLGRNPSIIDGAIGRLGSVLATGCGSGSPQCRQFAQRER